MIDLEGTLDGSATVSGVAGVATPFFDGLSGSSVVEGVFGQTFIIGGQVKGQGALVDGHLLLFSGLLTGSSMILGFDPVTLIVLRGRIGGTSKLVDWVPLPAQGSGTLAGNMVVDRVLDSVCVLACEQGKTLQWGQVLGPDDLVLRIYDAKGNPYSPLSVTYALYWVTGQARQLVCSPVRHPVKDAVGVYRAVGILADCGQPGEWLIVWNYTGQEHPVEQSFVLTATEGLSSCGCAPSGW